MMYSFEGITTSNNMDTLDFVVLSQMNYCHTLEDIWSTV